MWAIPTKQGSGGSTEGIRATEVRDLREEGLGGQTEECRADADKAG